MDWTAHEQNGKVTVALTCPDDRRGLYRAYAVGVGGGRCLLGALTPQNGRLTLRRALGVDALQQRNCYPIAHVDVELVQPFAPPLPPLPGWTPPPGSLSFSDSLLSAAFAKTAPKPYYRATAVGFDLAYPWAPNVPFPLPLLFCLAQPDCVCGQPLWRFSFSAGGVPILDA